MLRTDELKESAARAALDLVTDGMRLGLGTGSTAARFVAALGEQVAKGLNVVCVPTSESTRTQAERLGIPLTTLDETPQLDLTVDGADEIDDQLRMIKGGGGALLREKIVATASDRMVVIADESKLVGALGIFPLPVEVVRFGLLATMRLIEAIAAETGCHGAISAQAGARRRPLRHRSRQSHPRLRLRHHPRARGARLFPETRARRGRARVVSWARRFGYRGGQRRRQSFTPRRSLTPIG